MTPRQELEKDRTINRQIATNAHTPQCCKHANGSEIRRAGCNETKDRGDTDGEIERPTAPEDIAAEAPEDGAEEEAEHGDDPKRGRGGETANQLSLAQDRAGADEADAGEYAERETHDIELDKGRRRLAGGADKEVRLDHCEGRGEADEHGGTHAGSLAVLVPVEADEEAGDDGEAESKGDLLPGEGKKHVGWERYYSPRSSSMAWSSDSAWALPVRFAAAMPAWRGVRASSVRLSLSRSCADI